MIFSRNRKSGIIEMIFVRKPFFRKKFGLMTAVPVSHKIDLLIEIEGLLFASSNECRERVIELLPKLKNPILISNMILELGEIMPLHFQELFSFCTKLKNLNLLSTTPFASTSRITYSYFGDYLIKKGIFTREQLPNIKKFDKSIDEYQHPLSKNSLAQAIYRDDIEDLNEITKNKNLEKESISFMDNERISCFDFAVFVGAEGIVSYLIKNFYEIDEDVPDYAIRGGNETIIEILSNIDLSFDNQLENAIQYHQNHTFHWLLKNYKSTEKISIEWCVEMFNTEILVFLLSDGHLINERGWNQKTALISASAINNIILARFLVNRGADKTLVDEFEKNALDYAQTNKMKKECSFNDKEEK